MARRRNRSEERELAEARIRTLHAEARLAHAAEPARANRYAALMRAVAEKHQTGLGAARHDVCRACGVFLGAANRRVRVRAGRLVSTCLACGGATRRPLHASRPARPSSPSGVEAHRSPAQAPRRFLSQGA